jgi:hypothetical protein
LYNNSKVYRKNDDNSGGEIK